MSNVVPSDETVSERSFHMSQAEDYEARSQDVCASQNSLGSPVSVMSTFIQHSDQGSERPALSEQEGTCYAHVPQQDQDDRGSSHSAINESLPDSYREGLPDLEPRTLKRSLFQWWLVTPMDVLLALTPLFFLGKSTFKGSEFNSQLTIRSHCLLSTLAQPPARLKIWK